MRGTHAHSYVQAHVGMADITNRRLPYNPTSKTPGSDCADFVALVQESLELLNREVRDFLPEAQRWGKTNESELAAFASYALAFPAGFLALVDTYDVLKSGVPNFLAVALALRCGYQALGVRLDSGDLSYLSLRARTMRAAAPALGSARAGAEDFGITASNDIHEEVLHSLKQHGHAITAFGIGTHLVTCLRQPALGCVYKLVEIDEARRASSSARTSRR